MALPNNFQTSILRPEEGLTAKELYDHYSKEWERLERTAKLAKAANQPSALIQSIYVLMDEVTMILEGFID
jgi:hypothetical protein